MGTARKAQLSQFLRAEGIQWADDGDVRGMRAAAIRRLKRKAREKGRKDPLGVVFGADTALSLSDVLALAKDMRANGFSCKRFERILFKIDDVADNMTVLKHKPECMGRVVDGKCRKCGEVTPGETSYKLELVLADLKNDS